MDEASFWNQRLRPLLVRECQRQKLKHDFHRVENSVAAGTLDVNYVIDGVEGWLELKFTDRLPVSDQSKVLGKGNGVRRSQITWICRRSWAGGRVFVGVGASLQIYLIDVSTYTPEMLDDIQHWSLQDFKERSTWNFSKEVQIPDSLSPARILKGEKTCETT